MISVWPHLTRILPSKYKNIPEPERPLKRERLIQLYERQEGPRCVIWAKIAENGDLEVEGYDYDDDDYNEFWVNVEAKDKSSLLNALIDALYDGDGSAITEQIGDKNNILLLLIYELCSGSSSAVIEFEDFCNEKGIECYAESGW